MDAHFSTDPNYPTHNRQSYTQLSDLQPTFQQTSHTLPPRQPSRAALGYPVELYNQSSQPPPQVSFASNTIASTTTYSPYESQILSRYHGPRGAYSSLTQYANTQNFSSHSPSNISYSQSHSSLQAHGRLPDLLPMPTGGSSQSNGLSMPQMTSNSLASLTSLEHDSPPTHVVGAQGRRGILPSVAGRPTAIANGSAPTTKQSATPAKDAEGKFPCPHCNKTYLHAKHLKRHLLRHTGDRPYMCILCKDTFSRSDILKRHFQKCSVRRGNPTGATHLSHSHAHVKKSQHGKKGSISDGTDPSLILQSHMAASNLDTSFDDDDIMGLDIAGYTDEHSSMSTPGSRSNSMIRPGINGNARDRRSLTGPSTSSFNATNFPYPQLHVPSNSLSHSTLSTPLDTPKIRQSDGFTRPVKLEQTGSGADLDTNGTALPPHIYDQDSLSQLGGTSRAEDSSFEWASAFQLGARDRYMNPTISSTIADVQPHIKIEPESNKLPFSQSLDVQHGGVLNSIFDGSPSSTVGGLADVHGWSLDGSDIDPFQRKADQLISFCLIEGKRGTTIDHSGSLSLKHVLTAENVKHFLDRFSNFQGHWPVLHTPTFNPLQAYDGLLLSMICIGAVYSERTSILQVRDLMAKTKTAIDRTSHIFDLSSDSTTKSDVYGNNSRNIEELQASIMLQTLSVWHGDPAQRQYARNEFSRIAVIARKHGMLQPVKLGEEGYSPLHQAQLRPEDMAAIPWDWIAWVQQEKRLRLMYSFFLVDAALVIYFNCQPQFDPCEIMVPLPADDAAWDARSSEECSNALGLNGPAAQSNNSTGSRRIKQPEMHFAMRALLHPTYTFQRNSTNAYSKFILIHGLHVQIWNVQRQLSQGNALFGLSDLGFSSNGSTTPILQNDWIFKSDGSARTSNSNSGQATPTDSSGAQSPGTHQLLKTTTNALQKWKITWDDDMRSQYPATTNGLKRVGFCRDGIHFYWLARLFIRNTRVADWHAPSDQRFIQVMHQLKQVRSWINSEKILRGEDIGSVGDIDESYGVADLTLDMKLLFTPLSPGPRNSIEGLQSMSGRNEI